jgi:GNAT superfamily N-acetyltransferase
VKGSHQIQLDVPVETAWSALVAPGRRRWYYRLTPEGDFIRGGRVRWMLPTGKMAEESEVIDVVPQSRLAMRTRFVFAPVFEAQPPHEVTWHVAPEGSGCRVQWSWEAGELVHNMFASEGEYVLQALRLEHDPAAQAEIARLPRIGPIEIRDVTPDRVRDYQAFFDRDAFRDYPAWQACYCMEPHADFSDEEAAARAARDNRRDMTEMITDRKVAALLAYVDGKPVGWCNYGETTKLAGVMRRYELQIDDHRDVGSVACFVIAAPYRGHGVATLLLEAVLDRLRARGLKAVEAYPLKEIDSPQSNFRGPIGMYLKAGFEPYREAGPVQVVRKRL